LLAIVCPDKYVELLGSGSFEFAGSALVFHKTSGEPFTVTYTIDAIAKGMTR